MKIVYRIVIVIILPETALSRWPLVILQFMKSSLGPSIERDRTIKSGYLRLFLIGFYRAFSRLWKVPFKKEFGRVFGPTSLKEMPFLGWGKEHVNFLVRSKERFSLTNYFFFFFPIILLYLFRNGKYLNKICILLSKKRWNHVVLHFHMVKQKKKMLHLLAIVVVVRCYGHDKIRLEYWSIFLERIPIIFLFVSSSD